MGAAGRNPRIRFFPGGKASRAHDGVRVAVVVALRLVLEHTEAFIQMSGTIHGGDDYGDARPYRLAGSVHAELSCHGQFRSRRRSLGALLG
jgi:hypothetical protein